MPALRIEGFGGEVPRQSDTELRQEEATLAENVKLYSGELRSWSGPRTEFDPVTTGLRSIYRFKNPSTSAVIWLTWALDVDVQRSSLDDPTDFRLYYTGNGIPKKTNWLLANTAGAIAYPRDEYSMKVPTPTGAPSAVDTATGSSVIAETRYYVYTNVSTFGTLKEESAPSPPSLAATIAAGRKVTVGTFTAIPAGDYNITHRRIYRTLPGEKSIGAFVFVAEITVGTTSYVDDLLAAALGEPISTTGWSEPPDGLLGLTAMANGMMAGFVGNSVYFCEPYFHHAWPVAYVQSVPDQVIGLGSYGNTLIVLTTGQPWSMVGVSPDQISVEKISMPEPCIAKRSIVSDQYGVLYASPNGVVALGPTTREVITKKLFRRAEWLEYAPDTMSAAIYDGKYFATYLSLIRGNKTLILSRDDYPALSFLTMRGAAFFSDQQEGALYYADPADDIIKQFDFDKVNPYIYEWVSKRFAFPKGVTFSTLRLDISEKQIEDNNTYAALVAQIQAANALITGATGGEYNGAAYDVYGYNSSILREVPPAGANVTAVVTLIGEKDVIKTAITVTEYRPYRINSFKTREVKIRLTGNLDVRSITLATSVEELRDIGT